MSEVVLVVLQHADTAPTLLSAAERLAELTDGAHLSVLALADRAPLALKASFQNWRAGPHPVALDAKWHPLSETADGAREVEERGARADLIVIARPSDHDDRETRRIFRAALLKAGRPVLVIPPVQLARPAFGSRVAIAWRRDEHTAKTILPTLRYITRAERVFLLMGMRKGGVPQLPGVLTNHQINAETHILSTRPGTFGPALLAKAHELMADLLVMGAYAHSPLHHLVYGGVTRFLLQHADLPLMMRY